jgi:hypothetical protein
MEFKNYFLFIMNLGIVYPLFYDSMQLYKLGIKGYFSDFWNYTDFLFIWGGFINIAQQYQSNSNNFNNKLVQIIIILLAIIKTFFFLRVIQSMSKIVTMLQKVMYDLRIFIIFYMIVVFLFSLVFCVLGIGNSRTQGQFRDYVRSLPPGSSYPESEYMYIGMFWGNIIYVLRASVGDFNFDAAMYLTPSENQVFWFVWMIVLLLTMIVFLNFIISDIGASYAKYGEVL